MAISRGDKLTLLSLSETGLHSWLISFTDLPAAEQAITIEHLSSEVCALLSRQTLEDEKQVSQAVELFLAISNGPYRPSSVAVLLDCSFYYSRVGRSIHGRMLAERLLTSILTTLETPYLRRTHNLLGVMYMEAADFQMSLSHLEQSLRYAYALGDELNIVPCLANAAGTLKEMGHYRDSVAISLSILEIETEHPIIKHLQFQSATNGLFCAHRMHDAHKALQFLTRGNELIQSIDFDPLMKATYEYYRALYLIDTFDHETAEELVAAARRTIGQTKNPRVDILLRIPEALCMWASRTDKGYLGARKELRGLYEHTKKSRLYHDDTLRALMKIYGSAMEPDGAKLGMQYAKELVEYTTSVKRAKFYRQLSERGVEVDPPLPKLVYPFDPFANVRQWLSIKQSSNSEELVSVQKKVEETPSPRISSHDELTAIHDDIARLRTEAILKEIRSVAYDTAENWALAAEFFDDQTGQHCFRVGHLAGMLAREIGLEPGYCARVEHASRLHDLGKVGVNEMILLKPGPLDPSELTAMRAHAEVGAYMLQGSNDPVLQMAAIIAKHHHEWWNGAGYPASLSDRRIPLAARICAFADVYDALTHARPYKGAWPHRVAVEEMLNLAGVQFDPHLIRPFLRVLERYVPALAAGRVPGLAHLEANGLIASRRKLLQVIESQR